MQLSLTPDESRLLELWDLAKSEGRAADFLCSLPPEVAARCTDLLTARADPTAAPKKPGIARSRRLNGRDHE